MSARNFPIEAQPEYDKPEMIKQDIRLARELCTMPEIDKKDADQVRQRLDWYFTWCEINHLRPLVTGLCACLNTTRQGLINIEKENSERGRIVKAAKNTIRFLLEKWSVSGQLSPPIAIFWCKNALGMVDNITITAQTNEEIPKAEHTPEDIKRMLVADIPIDSDYKEI